MNATGPLRADAKEIARFFDALFRHADEGSNVSLRAFYDDAKEVYGIRAHRLTSDPSAIVAAATDFATKAAQAARPVVFAPPIATFSNGRGASEGDLANGLVLSVECDKCPAEARRALEALLGPATIVVASGGEWPNPETGELEPKVHLHWRLTEPTRDEASHTKLKLCRAMAKSLVGADGTSAPTVHPMRWPGSWHRKNAPRLARILVETDAELDLEDAEQRLRDAWEVNRQQHAKGGEPPPNEPEKGEPRDTGTLITAIVNGEDYHAPITALAMRFLKGGMADAQVVLALRGFMNAVPRAVRDIKDGVVHPLRWQARYDDIPRAVSTARAEIDAENAKAAREDLFGTERIGNFRLDVMTSGVPPQQEFLLSPLMPLGKVGLIFGAGGIGKSLVALDLCLSVALRARFSAAAVGGVSVLGCQVPAAAAGASVFLTLEDDTAEIHRRIAALDPQNRRQGAPCYVIPAVDLPNFDPALIIPEGRAAALTAFAVDGLDRLLNTIAASSGQKVRLLVLDPAGDFLNADENDATFVKLLMRHLRAVAARHGCTIILVGHVAKGVDIDNPTMRGSSAWIANSRFAYALSAPPLGEAEKLAKAVGESALALVWGKLVKANHAGAPVGETRLFVRQRQTGEFVDITDRTSTGDMGEDQLLDVLVTACAESAAAGMPYSYSGVAGLWTQRTDLPMPLANLSKRRLEALGTRALETGLLVKARTTITQGAPKYLDVPGGPLAMGVEIEMFHGSRGEAIERHRAGKTR